MKGARAATAGFALGLWACDTPREPRIVEEIELSPEVEHVLAGKEQLLESFLRDPLFAEAVRIAALEHDHLSPDEILELDRKWSANVGPDGPGRAVLSHPCSERLRQFQGKHKGFAEIFLTDRYGLNVCQTNKTSDYFQADEAWWTRAASQRDSERLRGPIEYDVSAETVGIAIYVPLTDRETNELRGVCKALIDFTSIKERL